MASRAIQPAVMPPMLHVPAVRLVARDWRACQTPAEIARWDALAAWPAEPNPFLEPWYLLPALRSFDPEGKVVLLCLEADGLLTGLLPLRREGLYYRHRLPHWRGWLHGNAFLGTPLVARGFETWFWRELLSWCDAHAGPAMFLHLAQMTTDGPLHDALQAVLAERQRPAAVVMREERAMLRSDLGPEAYLERSLSGKKRKELRRQHRRLAEDGDLACERLRGYDGLAEWADTFLALEQRGWKGAAGSALASDPRTRSLFIEALAGAARRGKLERLAIRLDGRPIAMLANFICPPGAFSFKTAFDEGFARYSPGVLLQCENLALLDHPKVDWADSCAAADHPMIDHLWRERREVVRLSIGLGGALRRGAFKLIAAREMRARA